MAKKMNIFFRAHLEEASPHSGRRFYPPAVSPTLFEVDEVFKKKYPGQTSNIEMACRESDETLMGHQVDGWFTENEKCVLIVVKRNSDAN